MEPPTFSIDTAGDVLIKLVIDRSLNVFLAMDAGVLGIGLAILIMIFLATLLRHDFSRSMFGKRLEIDQAHFGVGKQKLVLRPNETDRQIAYRIWIELSTRKLGLEINPDDDVISELYDSWYTFFSVTRELVKDVPVSKFRRKDTERIVRLSIEVLNNGIRPHLTKWHARFRRWNKSALDEIRNAEKSPQEVQREFPDYDILVADMERVNKRLIHYRKKMYELAMTAR